MGSTLFRLLTTTLVVLVAVIVLSLPFVIAGRRLPTVRPIVYSDSGYVAADSLGLDSARAAGTLAAIEDPELRLPITELGLLHSLTVTPAGDIKAVIGLTLPHCPYAARLAEEAFVALQSLPGARTVEVRVDPSLRWDPSKTTARGREAFRRFFSRDSGYSR